MKKRARFPRHTISAILFLLLASCSLQKTPSPVPLIALSNSPCTPPCWHNIIPGKSTIDDVRLLIDQIPGIEPENSAFVGPRSGYNNLFIGDFVDSASRLEIYFVASTVSSVLIHGNLGINVDQFITIYDDPESVVLHLAGGGDEYYLEISLLYPEKGIVASFRSEEFEYGTIRPHIMIDNLLIIDPSQFRNTLIRESTWITEETLEQNNFSWSGYQDVPWK